jgi:hypothetical protein
MAGKCPGCEQMVDVDLRPGPIGNRLVGPMISGFTAVCPQCQTILGVVNDPDQIANMIIQRLPKAGR